MRRVRRVSVESEKSEERQTFREGGTLKEAVVSCKLKCSKEKLTALLFTPSKNKPQSYLHNEVYNISI